MRRLACSASKYVHHGLIQRRCLSHFRVVEHVVPTQHTRHYPSGVEPGHDHDLKLAVKQYVPLDADLAGDRSEGVTVIGAHANGFPKEMYEPMWDDVYDVLKTKGKKVRSIWVADIATQGKSGILNEGILGDDPSWWDHARDLLFLINQRQNDMPQPLVGVGHSVGAAHLAALSLLHPRLFQALVLIDPVIQMENPSMNFAPPSTYRRDLWPSRTDAAVAFRKSKFYQKWDERVLEKWIEHGLRELPTELYPDTQKGNGGEKPVTLATTKAQEVFQYLRPLYKSDPWTDKELYADFDSEVLKANDRFYRPEPREIFRRLSEIRPPVRYIFGARSELATPGLRREKLESTGSGIGGNRGVARGKVSETILDCGHLVSMEKTKECAIVAANFVNEELDKWDARTKDFEARWKSKSRCEKIDIDAEWKRNIGPPPERPPKAANKPPGS